MQRNIIVGQSGGPTAVINSSLAGVIQGAKELGADKIYGMRHGIQGLLEGEYVLLNDYITSPMDIDLLKRTPSSYLGSCRYKLPEIEAGKEIYEKIFARLEELEIYAFFYIGGNDSMDTIKKLSDYAALVGSDIKFMGVPKTIDNDLAATDHTPGYGSAAKFIATATKEIIQDGLVYGIKSVTIIEIMGRNAGWLAASAALAQSPDCPGVDLLYLPENVFDLEAFMAKIESLIATKKSVVVAVSEGIKLADGRYVFEQQSEASFVDAFGHKQLQGTAKVLADTITARLGVKARAVELSTMQRCASHMASNTDVTEAFQVGATAVKLAFEGKTGQVVTLDRISQTPYICTCGYQDVHLIANVEKTVPAEWITEEGTNVSQELINYIRPLIQGEVPPMMVDGLPRHIYLG